MSKPDIIALIKAWDAFRNLDDAIGAFTDSGINYNYSSALWNISELIRSHSKYRHETADEPLDEYHKIINDQSMTPEERYSLIILKK